VISELFTAEEIETLVLTAGELIVYADPSDVREHLSAQQVELASIVHALNDAADLGELHDHVREATTPLPGGTLLADCSCGGTYSVPQGGNEYLALTRAHGEHIAEAEA